MDTPKSGFTATVFSALLRPFLSHLARPSSPKYRGNVVIRGLESKVDIRWQEYGIPHVFAANEHDLFFAQGYLHAQERLWQMDLSRRFLTGRMAEIFGSFPIPWKELSSHFRGHNSVDFDYFLRLIGIRHAALASLGLLPDDDRQRLEAYSEGVNRYIEQCGKKLPWEFRILRFEPEPWKPEDSLTIGKGFALLLSTALFTRLNMIALAAKLEGQPEKLHSLCPSYPEDGPTITRAMWDSARGVWQFMSNTFAASDWHPASHGSNNWVVAPNRSATGNTILCNDPHLRTTLPSIWYLMHLKAEPNPTQADGYEVWGASMPGSPCIQLGHNRRIAWGVTAALCDDVELYREKIHRLEPNLYLAGGRWEKIQNRTEIIRVRMRGEIKKVVRTTRHGPVLGDFQPSHGSSEVLTMRWTAHEPSREFRCLYGVNRARNWSEFLASLSHQVDPTLNYVYADQEGNIGYSLAGKIPIRPSTPSLLPLDGWREENEWRGFIPFDELPRLYNPPEGMIATANHRIADSSYPYYLSHFFEPPHRIRRIRELLAAKQVRSINDMAEMQKDVLSLHAKELIETLKVDLGDLPLENPQLKSAANRLLKWDCNCHEDSVESAIFHVFHHRLLANLLVPELGEEIFSAYVEILNQSVTPTDQILKDSGSPWFSTQSRKEVVAKSLREAYAELARTLGDDPERWHWGRIHCLTLNHSLGRLRILQPLVSIGPLTSSGDGMTINMGFYRHSDPYRHTVGASLRFIIDLGHWERSGFILMSGQSGHPFSRHYRDQTTLWQKGEFLRFYDTEEMQNLPSLSLIPVRK